MADTSREPVPPVRRYLRTAGALLFLCAVIGAVTTWRMSREGYYFRYLKPFDWYARIKGVYRYDAANGILRQGASAKRVVALTFDDGPHEQTPQLLDILRARGARATFFVVGDNVVKWPATAKRIVAEGHEIASHARNHLALPTLRDDQVRNEVINNNIVVKRIAGVEMRCFRPPYGRYDDRVLKVAREAGLVTVLWSNNTGDWKARDPQWLVRRVTSDLQPGDIILMHECHPNTLEAMPGILAEIRAKGYETVTVSELMRLSGVTPSVR
jgi:peptidoglycan/xylan/chitin deacetylase (PgdA/CDA1 family)